mmetsp:Transcript_156919/g.292808  ORF Transcript_156919/g.292808 Transcript_156919/m.292808 type:complete len:218 (-) Transcript_156919:1354-2007(-)
MSFLYLIQEDHSIRPLLEQFRQVSSSDYSLGRPEKAFLVLCKREDVHVESAKAAISLQFCNGSVKDGLSQGARQQRFPCARGSSKQQHQRPVLTPHPAEPQSHVAWVACQTFQRTSLPNKCLTQLVFETLRDAGCPTSLSLSGLAGDFSLWEFNTRRQRRDSELLNYIYSQCWKALFCPIGHYQAVQKLQMLQCSGRGVRSQNGSQGAASRRLPSRQ